MFKKEDFDITFRILRNYYDYDVVIVDNDFEELLITLESFISRGKFDDAIQYLKYVISYATIYVRDKSSQDELRKQLYAKCNEIHIIIEDLAANNPSNNLAYGVLDNYLKSLIYNLSFSQIKSEYIPDTWINVSDFEYKGSLSRPVEGLYVTKFCSVRTDENEIPEIIGKHLYQLQSLIGVFYALDFMKKMNVTELRTQIDALSKQDFGFNSTANYIKNEINPTKYPEQVKAYLFGLCLMIRKTKTVNLIDQFKPNHCISGQLASLLKDIVSKFPNYGGYQWTQVEDICFNVVEKDESYFHKELGYLVQKIEDAISIV